jgi:hypothetical protein
VRYVVAFQPLDLPGARLIGRFPDLFSWIYEITDSVPRVYIAREILHEPSDLKKLRMLASPDFDPHAAVLVDAAGESVQGSGAAGDAKLVSESNNRVLIQAQLKKPGMLVLTDSFYPGWKVSVNGTDGQIVRANYFFRGVALPAGNHAVEFKYEPFTFQLGMAISFTTALAVIITVVAIAWRRTRRKSERPFLVRGQPVTVD